MYDSEEKKQKLFNRPILYLPKLVRGELRGFNYTDDDIKALNAGFFYKVLDTKEGKSKTRCYCKTINEARAQAKIIYRGLFRASWGMNLESVGGRMDVNTKRVLKDSPRLTELRGVTNPMRFGVAENGTEYLEIWNKAEGVKLTYKVFIREYAMHYATQTLARAVRDIPVRILKKALRTARKELVSYYNEMDAFTGGSTNVDELFANDLIQYSNKTGSSFTFDRNTNTVFIK